MVFYFYAQLLYYTVTLKWTFLHFLVRLNEFKIRAVIDYVKINF